MTRFVAGASLAIALTLAPAPAPAPAGQDWRAPALASFDEVWKTINETFYDPTFGGLDWAAAGRELRPRVVAAASAEEARAVIRDLLARLKRSHFVLLSSTSPDALPGPAVIPADVRITSDGVLITRVTDAPATTAGLAAGQILLAVDGRDVADLMALAQGLDSKTRSLDAWRRVNQALHGADGSVATLRVRGIDAQTLELRVARSLGTGEVVTLGNLPPLRVEFLSREMTTPGGRRAGVIGFSVWMTAIADRFEQAIDQFRRADGLVIDLRGNPGGLAGMMGGISGHLISEPKLLGTMRTRQAQLRFSVNPRFATSDGRRVEPYAGPVALLVDELTGSTSETFSGALQSLGRARVFGRPTMGQALPALTRQLPNGDVLLHAIGDFITATGKSLEGDGVIPDVPVSLSPKALAQGRDETLEAALRWFDTLKSGR